MMEFLQNIHFQLERNQLLRGFSLHNIPGVGWGLFIVGAQSGREKPAQDRQDEDA